MKKGARVRMNRMRELLRKEMRLDGDNDNDVHQGILLTTSWSTQTKYPINQVLKH
eukprot:m.196977 g.196977  ORF g.196977 m.196977 type:complete len:55 (+) comp39535_c1_seq2:3362-3526(+)